MARTRDLILQNLDMDYRSSVAYQLARYVLSVSYESLPPEVVHCAKRILLDTVACVIGASDAPGRPLLERTARALGGVPESTLFGSGFRTSAANATLVNSFMVRYLDCNDMGGGGHNSEAIPAILAVAERESASGQAFLTSLVLSYEIGARIKESATGALLELRGWNVDCRAGLSMPGVLGKLMWLNEDQIANAIAIGGAHAPSLGILDTDREEMMMAKNLRFGFAAQHAIIACIMAKEGFTGFPRVVEGDKGFREMLYNNEMDLQRLVDFSGWRILQGGFKTICQNWATQSHILATLALVKQHDLRPEDIASVKIKTSPRDARHTGGLSKKYPRNTETATHSGYFANAMVIKERALGPQQLKPEKFADPVILDLIERITIEGDPNIPYPSGSSTITTVDGRRFENYVTVPHGDKSDPVTDGEIVEKFKRFAEPHIRGERIQSIIDTVWNVDRLKTMDDLTRLLVWE